jgi:hypothetical protein
MITETIKEKYLRLRESINDGDIILFSGNTIVSKIIRNCDRNATWSHCEIITKTKEERLLVQGANLNGVHPEYLSLRLKYHNDFIVLRPLASRESINEALKIAFSKVDSDIKYDYFNGFKELVNRKYGTNLEIIKSNKSICSFFAAPYAIKLNMVLDEFDTLRLPFPQDYIRYINKQFAIIIT